jgi:GxxExxY protein
LRGSIGVTYEGMTIDLAYRIDLRVESAVVVEVKAISKVLPVHEAQLLSYLKLGEYKIGLLINFHEAHLRDGIKRLVNKY